MACSTSSRKSRLTLVSTRIENLVQYANPFGFARLSPSQRREEHTCTNITNNRLFALARRVPGPQHQLKDESQHAQRYYYILQTTTVIKAYATDRIVSTVHIKYTFAPRLCKTGLFSIVKS